MRYKVQGLVAQYLMELHPH